MIIESLIQQFERDGFLVLPQVLSRDVVSQLVMAGDKWIASDHQTQREVMGTQTDSFRNCVALDDLFLDLLAHQKVLPYVVRLLGPDIKLLTSHLLYRHPAPAGTSLADRCPQWHRDFAKAQRSLGHDVMPRLDIKVAFCLTDLPTHGCGGTLFLPGSHLLREKLKVKSGCDPPGAIEPVVHRGDCILFENRTWHAGGANVHGTTRKAVMIGYTYVWIQPSDYDHHSPQTLRAAEDRFGDVGLQLLVVEPTGHRVQGHFDFGQALIGANQHRR